MSTAAPIEITLEYALTNGDTKTVDLLPRDYFEPDVLESGAALDVDSEPLYFDNADYLDADPADLAWVKLSLRNKDSERTLAFNTSYWNSGRNQITSKTEWQEGVIVTEVTTISLTTQDEPDVSHVIRAETREGLLVPVYHRVFTATDAGEREDEIL